MTRLNNPVARVTRCALDGTYGPDRDRPVVIKLIPGDPETNIPDMMELRPLGTRRSERVAVMDVYRYALRCRVNRDVLEKARHKKERKAQRLADLRQKRAEKRLLRPI